MFTRANDISMWCSVTEKLNLLNFYIGDFKIIYLNVFVPVDTYRSRFLGDGILYLFLDKI